AAKRVRGIIRETHRWCATPSNDRRESSMKDIRKYLAKNDTGRAVLCLGLSANWHGQQGARAILDGEREGWAEIDRAFHYLWLDACVVTHRQASEAASVLATAVVFGEDAMADPLAARLIRSMDDRKLFIVWEESAFAAFMLKLWGLYRGMEVDVARPKV